MKKKLVKISLGLVAALTVGTLFLAFGSAPLQVETLTLSAADAVITYTGQGTMVYKTTMDVTAPVSGEVAEVPVQEGQALKKGDTIAVLSVPDVDYQIQRLQADIKGYQAQITALSLSEQKERDALAGTRGELEGQLSTLEAERRSEENAEATREEKIILQERIVDQDVEKLHLARRDLRNYRDDYGSGDSSDPDYNALKAAVNQAEKELRTSEQTLLELQGGGVEEGYYEGREESLQAQINSIDTQLGKTYSYGDQAYYSALIEHAQLSIQELTQQQGRATVTAPYDCVISSMDLQAGMQIKAGDSLALVGCTPLMEVLVPVRERDGIALGDEATLTISKRAGEETAYAIVTEIAGQAQVQLSPLGVEESKVRILLTVDGDIPVGSQGDVEFTVYRQENAIVLPQKSIFQQEEGYGVWVIREGEAHIQPVQRGAQVRGGYLITQGLQQGDVVVADANTQGLKEGAQAREA